MADKVVEWVPLTYKKEAPKVNKTHKVKTTSWTSYPRWVQVHSTNVKRIKYNQKQKHLFIEFKNNAVYRYDDVPIEVAVDFFNSSSMGRFVWRRLRDRFAYERIE
jgi:hypothetical protein